jgi:type IV pilus assembly protein PilV
VVAVGLLGVAKMHALLIAGTSSARMRTLAAIEAASLVSSMHGDRAYWASPATAPATVEIRGSKITGSDTTLGRPAMPCTADSGRARPYCNSAELAAYDLQTWSATLATLLPNDRAKVQCSAAAMGGAVVNASPVTCTIQIEWSENAVAANSQQSTQADQAAPFQLPTYTVYVEP